jgi:hypothetical protein
MSHPTDHKYRTSALRRLLTALLAVAYLLVGFSGEVWCAEETLEIGNATIAVSSEVNAATEKSDEGSKKAPTVVEHCYTCVPLLIPAPVLVAEPSAQPVRASFPAPMFVLEDHPGLDTPPPKHLIRKS